MFDLADRARDSGNTAVAEQAYRALATNPDAELRAEARFRLALMLAGRLHRYRDAAVELRRILDEKPRAARVRLELARVQALMGNLSAARRELRGAEASGLPPEVERMVRFYAAALDASKRFGGSFELALAPDSNINRATRADSLGTVLGNFTLSDDARARSGLGFAARGQAYVRAPVSRRASLVARASTSADLYRDPAFHDVSFGLQAGPELAFGRDRLTLAAGPTWRWYGAQPYSLALGGSAALIHPLGPRTQVRVDGALSHVANRRNEWQTATVAALSAGFDHALSARLGLGLFASISRTAARDPGWSDVTAGLSAYAFREIGRTTAVVAVGYGRLEADERLNLYPERRVDDRLFASATATWRRLQWKGLAPYTRLKWERNHSTVGVYAYARMAGELGMTMAF